MILEAVASMFAAESFDGNHPKDPAVRKMFGFNNQNTAGVSVTEETVLALPAIKRAVQIVTDKMFGMPWYVFEEQADGREFERSHPAWRCVHRVANPQMSAASLRQQLTQWAMTWGNGCAYIDRSGEHVELYPLLPDRTELVMITPRMIEQYGFDAKVGSVRYKTKIGDETRIFERHDVLHIRGLGGNPHWGWNLIDLLSECFAGVIAKDEFSNRFFSNGANPVGFIQMDGSLDEESEENYMKSISTAMSGLGKAHKLILLEEGAKFTPVTIDPIKSQMLEGKQFDVRLLAMAIGIKVHKLIDGANSAFASLEQANHEHKDDDILPWVNKHRVEYNEKLLTEEQADSGSHSIDVDDESLDWVPFTERATGSVELYNNGLITKDEGRRKVNFGPSRSARSKAFRIPANIVYEDDQAMVAADPASVPEKSEPDDEKKDKRADEITAWYLSKIEARLKKSAKTQAAKGNRDFISWLDALEPESGPESIQDQINDLYKTFCADTNRILETVKTDEELCHALGIT